MTLGKWFPHEEKWENGPYLQKTFTPDFKTYTFGIVLQFRIDWLNGYWWILGVYLTDLQDQVWEYRSSIFSKAEISNVFTVSSIEASISSIDDIFLVFVIFFLYFFRRKRRFLKHTFFWKFWRPRLSPSLPLPPPLFNPMCLSTLALWRRLVRLDQVWLPQNRREAESLFARFTVALSSAQLKPTKLPYSWKIFAEGYVLSF